eukprot:8493258-Heterocapsa_arctica.AAC.1
MWARSRAVDEARLTLTRRQADGRMREIGVAGRSAVATLASHARLLKMSRRRDRVIERTRCDWHDVT